ncbi:PRC-barrel domain-containing protein [Jannaschia formosa]|uniref:PRC-barrel domain-containing protein n=1 Tax=Jannaschia formosa TaxID=2259592 RepID=UPI00143045A9|nr:PRC-barrel domain-containing protein [Jannaschia formosa]
MPKAPGPDPAPTPAPPPGTRDGPGETIRVEIQAADAPPAAPDEPERAAADADTPGPAPPPDLTAQEAPLSAILGLAARGADGSDRGEVEDVIVSLRTGRIVAVVLRSGGVLGLGGDTERIAVERIAIDPLGGAVVVSDEGGDGGDG